MAPGAGGSGRTKAKAGGSKPSAGPKDRLEKGGKRKRDVCRQCDLLRDVRTELRKDLGEEAVCEEAGPKQAAPLAITTQSVARMAARGAATDGQKREIPEDRFAALETDPQLSTSFQDKIVAFWRHTPMVFSRKHEGLLPKQDTVWVFCKTRNGSWLEKPTKKSWRLTKKNRLNFWRRTWCSTLSRVP